MHRSSGNRAVSIDFRLNLSTKDPILHRSRQVFQTASCVCAELLWVSTRWSTGTATSICWGYLEMESKLTFSCSFVGFCSQDYCRYNSYTSWVVSIKLLLKLLSQRLCGASIEMYWPNHYLEETLIYFIG